MATLLSQVRSLIAVDVDSMDPAVAARHTTDTVKFVDMTSNQAIVHAEASKPDCADLKAAVDRAKSASSDPEQQVSDALEILVRINVASSDGTIDVNSPDRRCSWPNG